MWLKLSKESQRKNTLRHSECSKQHGTKQQIKRLVGQKRAVSENVDASAYKQRLAGQSGARFNCFLHSLVYFSVSRPRVARLVWFIMRRIMGQNSRRSHTYLYSLLDFNVCFDCELLETMTPEPHLVLLIKLKSLSGISHLLDMLTTHRHLLFIIGHKPNKLRMSCILISKNICMFKG